MCNGETPSPIVRGVVIQKEEVEGSEVGVDRVRRRVEGRCVYSNPDAL